MFGIGTSEILIILLIALLVLGPKEIPKVARTLARGMRELQRAKDELRQTLDKEMEEESPKYKTEEREKNDLEESKSSPDSDTETKKESSLS